MMKTATAIAMTVALALGTASSAQAGGQRSGHNHDHHRGHDHGHDHGNRHVRNQLAQLKRATAKYRNTSNAFDDGYGAFAIPPEVGGTPTDGLGLMGDPTCFDSASGGMGVHYVNFIDGDVSMKQPEALVYEITKHGRLRLVAVEYIVPEELADPNDLPKLFGQEFHHHPYLPVYILHAWVWKHNPNGVFADFNPRVRPCPEPTT
jgi:hypothetical protein